MKTNNAKGRTYVIIVGAYLILKSILNMIIGGGLNIGDLIFAVIAAAAMFSGLQYLNIAVSAILAITVLTNLPHNLTHLPGTLIYLIEAAVDVGAIVLLLLQNDVKEHFTNKWSEFGELFKK